MFIYEKDNKLNVVFNSSTPVEEPDVVISKEGDVVSLDISGEASMLPAFTSADEGKVLTIDSKSGKPVWAESGKAGK